MIQLVQYTEHSKLNRCTLGDICAVYANISCGTGTGMGSVFKDRSLWKTKKRIKQRSPPYNSWSFLKTFKWARGTVYFCLGPFAHPRSRHQDEKDEGMFHFHVPSSKCSSNFKRQAFLFSNQQAWLWVQYTVLDNCFES